MLTLPPQNLAAEIDVWLFDLDNTLYPATSSVFDQVKARMQEFIQQRLNLDAGGASQLRDQFFQRHGTTLRGLMLDYGLHPQEFLDYVHEIDLSHLPEDARLAAAIAALPGRKIIYTNASRRHAENVLSRLGMINHFESVFAIHDADYVPKPEPAPYAQLIARHAVNPKRACMVEDMLANLHPAHSLGMQTVWVRPAEPHTPSHAEIEAARPHLNHIVEDLTSWLVAINGDTHGNRDANA